MSALHLVGMGIAPEILVGWAIIAFLGVFCFFATRKLSLSPGPLQSMLEGVVTAIEEAISAVNPDKAQMLLPFIGTLWIHVSISNLAGLVPGVPSPTGNLSVTAALSILVFLSVHWFGVKSAGWENYLRHYFKPSPILFPFHVIGEISRTVALAFRLFGNIMSLEMAAMLVLLVGGLLVPVPILMLHVVEALVQAYIFGMLALIYVSGGIESQTRRNQ